MAKGVEPVLDYEGTVTVPVAPNSSQTITLKVKSAFRLLKEKVMDDKWSPSNVASIAGIPADMITQLAQLLGDTAMRSPVIIQAEWENYLCRKHTQFIGRPVAIYIMRGISAHTNGFQTARDFMILEALLGAVDSPGGFRAKTPYPEPIPDGDFWPAYAGPADPRLNITQEDIQNGEVPATGPNGESLVGTNGAIKLNERVYNDGTVEILNVSKVPWPAALTVTTVPFMYTPDQVVVDENGRPLLIDRGFSWEFPLSLHRSYNVTNFDAGLEFPYRVEAILWHITNPYWDNQYDLDKDLRLILMKDTDGRYRIPFIMIVDTFYGNSVPWVDLVIPDTTFLERYGEHSLLDRPITTPNYAADNIEHPILPPLFDARPFSVTEIEIEYLLGISAWVNPDGTPRYPNGMGDFLWKWRNAPGVGVLIAARGTNGTECCKGAPNPNQLKAYTYPMPHVDFGYLSASAYGDHLEYPGLQEIPVTNGELPESVPRGVMKVGHAEGLYELPVNIRYLRAVNMYYLKWAQSVGFIPYVKPIPTQIYSEVIARFKLATYGLWKGYNAYFYYMYKKTGNAQYLQLAQTNANLPSSAYGKALQKRNAIAYDPRPHWYFPLSWTSDGDNPNDYPLLTENRHVTPWFYHHWENHHPWLRQILPFNPVFMNPQTCQQYGISTGDWVEFESWQGESGRFMVVCDETTKPGVIWYWKSRNIRPGVLAIDPESPEATIGSMFNDLYSQVLPPSLGGTSVQDYVNLNIQALTAQPALLNYDPFTGKTSWGDLRLRVKRVLGKGSYIVSYGLSDPYVLVLAMAPYNPKPNLPYLIYNA